MTTQHDYPDNQEYMCLCQNPPCRTRYFGPKRSVVCYACSQDEELSTQTEINCLKERLEELDKQAFLNYIETQEIVYRLKELRREIPEEQLAESYEAGYSDGREEGGNARYAEGYGDGYSDAESEYGVKGSE